MGIEVAEVSPFLRQWKVSNEFRRECRELVWGIKRRKEQLFTPMDLYRLQEHALTVEEILPYYNQAGQVGVTKEAVAALPIHKLSDLAVNGNDLLQASGRKPGPWLKEVLSYLEQAVVEKRSENDQTTLLRLAAEYIKE